MIMMAKELSEKSKKFSLFILPQELKNYGILSPEEAEAVFRIGYNATKNKLKDPEAKKLFNK